MSIKVFTYNDNVCILRGKYKGRQGYVTELHSYDRYSVRYQTGVGWKTSTYKNVSLLKMSTLQ